MLNEKILYYINGKHGYLLIIVFFLKSEEKQFVVLCSKDYGDILFCFT